MTGRDENLFDLTRPPSAAAYLKEAWRRRAFAILVPAQDLRAQNMGTALGQLWHLANPALLVGVYSWSSGWCSTPAAGSRTSWAFSLWAWSCSISPSVWYRIRQCASRATWA